MGSVTHIPVVGRLINDTDWVEEHNFELDATDVEGLGLANRTALAAITTPANGQYAYLAEAGREGDFIFSTANLSSQVTDDPRQAFYVPPAAAPTGASGAWVRRYTSFAHAGWFGAVGDGVTDDTASLTAFINSAIALPGVAHILDALTYRITGYLPTIDVSNVIIIGQGSDIHDVGALMSGSVIKYDGAALGVRVIAIEAQSGASNQRISNIVFRGIGIDCNELAYSGLCIKSARDCDIDVAIANATDRAFEMGVVATLGEARDPQNNRIRLKLRQVEEPLAKGMVVSGDATANVSMNHFWVDAQHKDATVLQSDNADNNSYHFFRAYRVPGGTATEAISLLGGATEPESCRCEKFDLYSANTPIHAYGTGTYTYPSTNHTAFLDTDNGTPVPTIDTGASVNYVKSTTATAEKDWDSFTPTITATSGTITTVTSPIGSYRKIGKKVEFKVQFTITTNGTGTGAVRITLPVASAGAVGQCVVGKERAVTGKSLVGFLDGGGATTCDVQYYDGVYPGTDGGAYAVSGSYEAA